MSKPPDDSEPIDLIERKSEQLADQGFEHLERGDTDAALAVAAELEKLEYTAAFEIAALAHGQLDQLDIAVEILERGVELAPECWVNLQLLGNYRSDLRRYEQAAQAYNQALSCPDVWESSIRLNQAILALRRAQHSEALAFVAQVTDPEIGLTAITVRIDALDGLGRLDDARTLGERTLAEAESSDLAELASLATSLGRVRLHQGASPAEVFEFALDALDTYDISNRGLLALIRDADNLYSPDAKYYRLVVDAKIPFTHPQYREFKGYIVNYDVIADSTTEALTFVERMEDPAVRGNLCIESQEVIVERTDDPKGVYSRSLRHSYENEEP